MIRVNLLVDTRVPRQEPGGGARNGPVALGCAVVLVVAVLLVGWQVWSLRVQSARVTHEIAAAERTLQQLAPGGADPAAALAALETRLDRLEQRLALADALRRTRGGAARMLGAVGRGVPEGLQLSALRQSPEGVVVEGHAGTLAALSEFVSNLEGSTPLAAPIEIIDSRTVDTLAGPGVRFGLRVRFAAPAS